MLIVFFFSTAQKELLESAYISIDDYHSNHTSMKTVAFLFLLLPRKAAESSIGEGGQKAEGGVSEAEEIHVIT